MDLVGTLSRQLGNSIEVIQQIIQNASDRVWIYGDPPFFQIVFHCIYGLDMYFTTFDPHYHKLPDEYRLPENLQQFEVLGFFDNTTETTEKIIPKQDLQKFLVETRRRLKNYFSNDIDKQFSDPAGFPWLNFNKLELVIHNIRHLMGHSGVLNEYLKRNNCKITGWVGGKDL